MTKSRYLPPGISHASQAYEMLADRLMAAVNGAEWKTAFYIARRTIGFGKETDMISLGQICKGIRTRDGRQLDAGTGLSRTAVIAAIKALKDRAVVNAGDGGPYKPHVMGLNWPLIATLEPEQRRSRNRASAKNASGGGAKDVPELVQKPHPQPSVNSQGVQGRDCDYAVRNRKERDCSPHAGLVALPASKPKPYPKLKQLIASYMADDPTLPQPDVFPTDDRVVAVLNAAGGASEGEVCEALKYLYHERGLKPGTKNGPRTFAWFVSVVRDHFDRQRAARPPNCHDWAEQNAVMERVYNTLD